MQGESGVMVALRGDEITTVDLGAATAEPRNLDPRRFDEAAWFFA
jgi:hypothetical protein